MPTVSRRGFLVLGGTGAAGAVLVSCGGEADDPRAEGRDGELLGAALAAELAVEAAARATADSGAGPGEEVALAKTILEHSSARVEELRSLAADAEAPESEQPAAQNGSLAAIAALSPAAIAAYREAAGLLSTTELRATTTAFLAASAGELAGADVVLGDEAAPQAFVTGGGEQPFEAAE